MVNLKQLADIERDLVGFDALKISLEKLPAKEHALALSVAARELQNQIEVLREAEKELSKTAPEFAKRVGLLLKLAEKELAELESQSELKN
jgi:hypothetical protein